MDLKVLRYFVAAVDERSIQRAASRMNIAQPALSRRIRDLEIELGCTLLERGARGVRPTLEGSALYRRARNILDDVDGATQDIRRMGLDQTRAPRLGLVQTSRKYAFIQSALAGFRAARPETRIDFTWGPSTDLAAALTDDRLDLSILYGRRQGGQHSFAERLIHRENYVLAVHPAHRLAGPGPIDLAQLSGEPMIWLSRHDSVDGYDELRQQCRLHGLDPVIAHIATNHVEQIDLTVVTAGIALVPSTTLVNLPEGMLQFRPIESFDAELRLSLAWRPNTDDAQLIGLLSQFHAAIDDHQHEIRSGRVAWAHLEGLTPVTAGS